jgi:hypothetical protein
MKDVIVVIFLKKIIGVFFSRINYRYMFTIL